MKYWIVPCRPSTFLVEAALKANEDEGGNTFVDWRQSYDFAVGDIVFIYEMYPKSQVSYRMEVVATELDFDQSTDKEVFWKDKALFYDGLGSHKYSRFRVTSTYPNGHMSLKSLQEHGLKRTVKGVMLVLDEKLLAFLTGETLDRDIDDDVTLPSDLGDIAVSEEGAVQEVVMTRYERSREAREACIRLKGCRCAVCGMDFESHYGEIGRGFIHVHHIIPISSIGETYQVNPSTDLVPVCPNCHNMLHRKEPPYSIEELQDIINNR